MPAQRGWLNVLAECDGDWNRACEIRKIKRDRVSTWIRTDPAFRAAYDAKWDQASDVARRRIEGLTGSAIDTMEELMAVTKKHRVEVQCPECGNSFRKTVEIKDATISKQMIDMILRTAGVLKDTTRHEVAGAILHLTAGETIALAQLKKGGKDAVTVPMLERLVELKLATPGGDVQQLESGDVIEGESREV